MSEPLLQSLAWDSVFMGFPVARLVANQLSAGKLAAIVNDARLLGTRLVYLVVAPTDNKTAEAAKAIGARLVDCKVTFVRQSGTLPDEFGEYGSEARIVPVTSWSTRLEKVAWQCGEFSRFRRDARFAPHVFTELYSNWLKLSLSGNRARVVLSASLATSNDVGFLTLEDHNQYASIGLLGVADGFRGQGIGRALVRVGLQEAIGWGCNAVQVATQRENAAACAFYTRCGFVTMAEEHIYHIWL